MSDRSRWEQKRRSPIAQYRHSNQNNSRSTSSDRYRSTYHESEKDRDWERDRDRDRDRDRNRDRNRERERRKDKDRERDHVKDFERERKERERDRDWNKDNRHRENGSRYTDRRDSDRFRNTDYHHDRISCEKSFSPKDLNEKRPRTPPYPPHYSNTVININKIQDSISSGYSSSAYSTPPPPPPSHAPSLSEKLTSLFGVPSKPKESIPSMNHKPNIDPRQQYQMKRQKSEPVKTDLRNFKLLIDPIIKKGHTKILRYDGILSGQPPVTPKDPRQRKSKLWTVDVCDLPVPKFSLDKNYIGPMPRDTVRFSGLNDNIDRKFLYELCEAYGDIIEYKVYFDPQSNKHMGTGKVVFDMKTNTEKVVSSLNGRSVMGKIVSAWVDVKNPPGYHLLKQLDVECQKWNSVRACLIQPIVSQNQPTPPTPIISSLQRNQPIAHNYQSSHYTEPLPPPPPPGRSNHVYLQASHKGPSTPPPPPPINNRLPHNDHQAHNKMSVQYSPVSDQSDSPGSPVRQAHANKYEAISDNEDGCLQVEDISPASLVEANKKEEEDDNMSLSSLSPGEGSKVELNVQSAKPVQQKALAVQPTNPSFPIPPPNFLPGMNQNFFPPHPPPNINTSIPLPNFLPPPQPPFNQQLSSNTLTRPPPPMPSAPNFLNSRHNEILQNALRGNISSINPLPAVNQGLIVTQPVRSQSLPPQIPQDRLPIQPPMPQESVSQNQYQSPAQPVPPSMDTLPFVFQVKAGCARDISQELKRILSRDTLKRLVEQSAFKAFENWWEKQKSISEIRIENTSKLSSNAIDHDKYIDKAVKEEHKENFNPSSKSAIATDLLQSIFAREKDNCNTSTFLSSFRISRRPQPKTPSHSKPQVSRKRRTWPNMSSSEKKRLEETDESDDEKDDESEDEDQLEQFALQQRKVQRIGSSLYQKIYSDGSDDEDDTGYNDTQSEDDDDDFIDDRKIESTVTESSSSSEDDSSSSESSSSSSSSLESDDELTELEEMCKKEAKEREEREKVAEKVVEQLSKEDRKKKEEKEEDNEIESKEESEKGAFRSMYDEPRRAAAQKALQSTVVKKPKASRVKLKKPPPLKKAKKPPRIIEESSSSSETESETEEEILEEEKIVDVPEIVKKRKRKIVEEDEVVDSSVNEAVSAEVDFINNLIMLEHNYFEPLTKDNERDADKNLSNKIQNRKNDSLNDKTLKRRRDETLEKSELKYKFQMRTKEEEEKIIWSLYDDVIDSEDKEYMKQAYESLQQMSSKEVENYSWVDMPLPPVYKAKRTKGEVKLRAHQTGCARSEGYYKIPIKEKAQYLKSALRQLTVLKQRDDVDQKTAASQASAEQKIKSRENRAMQRRLASSFAQEEFNSLINYNQHLKMRKKALRFAKSSIHNWGLFALEPIAAEEFVCEYVGTMVRSIVAELREQQYEKNGIGSSYLFRLDMESVIDATKTGCNARFINHSCQPNCYAKVILVEGAKKIVIYSKYDIALGEEITYDYKFPIEDEKIPCLCGAPQCRGSLN